MSEVQTVEVRFYGEKLATVTVEGRVHTLYRVPGDSYFVHIDEGGSGAYIVTGTSAGMPYGQLSEGISEAQVRQFWPELSSAAALD
jgi:hypothetical protein